MRIARPLFATVLLLAPLAAQTDWTLLSPAASPIAFSAHAMAYHLPTDRTVLFGGTFGGVRYNETWLWDGSTWTQATPVNVPPARVAHTLCYDEARGKLVLFGGIPAGGGYLGDTGEWDGVDWTQMTPATTPGPRRSHTMAYLPSRGTSILWGGYNGTDLFDTWEWDGVAWTQIVTASSPAGRRATDMAWDPVGGGLILFSGYQQGNDTWRFTGTTWQQVLPSNVPPARFDHSMVTDTARGRIVMVGGTTIADQWEWNGTTWLQRTPATLPSARSDTYLAYDFVREEVLMFGSSPTAETWRYAPTVRASFATSGVGCAGSLPNAPVLTSADRPWLGETFTVDIAPVPANTIGLMLYGLSDTFSATFGALPASLAVIGMPGCTLQVDMALVDAFFANGNTATWNLAIPNAAALLGGTIYCQGAALDLAANPFGFIVADHGAMLLGGK
ncbi:MAG: hypothetical protein JNK15_04135 [Planctomycetes bacterium]|nr:hypothetical protein [Planctomycetota bacterium]